MAIRTIKEADLKNKRVIMRVDFNVPLKEGTITDDTRITASLPSITYILEQGAASLVLMSHLGDPKKDMKKAKEKAEKAGKPFDEQAYLDGKHRMKPVAEHLAQLLGKPVGLAPDCMGEATEKMAAALPKGGVLLLENTRFHKEETSEDAAERESMAKAMAKLGDIYVNDAFGTAHRAHASTETLAHFLPAFGGFLMEKEVKYFEPLLKNPEKPFVAIIGGAKVSSKIAVLESLLKNATTMIIGGGMAYTFLKVMGKKIGTSLVEDDQLDTAKRILEQAKAKGVEILLPLDHVVASEFSEKAAAEQVDGQDVPDGKMGMDVGPKTLAVWKDRILKAKNVVWNGPVGVFEFEAFATGTLEIAKCVADCAGTTVVGGGDSVAAVNKFKLGDRIDHVSTGGGASLEFQGKTLPGIAALEKK